MTLVVNLEYNSTVPPFRRLSDALRTAILDGRLEPGGPLPSVRSLSITLKLSRSTVLRAIDDLKRQGYIETTSGSGTVVCRRLPGELAELLKRGKQSAATASTRQVNLSAYGRRVMDLDRTEIDWQRIDFGGPSLNLAPLKVWKRLMATQWSDVEELELAGYTSDPFGYRPLREALAGYLLRSRQVNSTADRVAVFGTKRLRLDAVARVLMCPGDAVAFEDPGYPEAAELLATLGAKLVPIPIDKDGMVVERLWDSEQPIKFVYVTPSHHDPSGATLSLERRHRLLQWAKHHHAFIIEDDYDHEYFYGSQRLPSLQGLDLSDRVIYMSSLWKILFPVVKFGFMVVPRCLTTVMQLAKFHLERSMPVAEQMALSDFINGGHLERYIRTSQSLLSVRRRALIYALTKHLPDRIALSGAGAGTHLLVHLKTSLGDTQITACAARANMPLLSTRPFYRHESRNNEFILSFNNVDEETITHCVQEFAAFVDRLELTTTEEES